MPLGPVAIYRRLNRTKMEQRILVMSCTALGAHDQMAGQDKYTKSILYIISYIIPKLEMNLKLHVAQSVKTNAKLILACKC